jgi:pyridoxine/pyridoxamine 5'-phosphate oxidase
VNVGEVFEFMNSGRLAVLSTVDEQGRPEAALIGYAVAPELEFIFDTVKSSRKYPNLKNNPRVAWVIGGMSEVTVQYEVITYELEGSEWAKYQKTYFAALPDGPARES